MPFPELTDRERDVLDHLAAGHSNAAIGDRLHLSAKTVANHVSNILNKLHLVEPQRGHRAGQGVWSRYQPLTGCAMLSSKLGLRARASRIHVGATEVG